MTAEMVNNSIHRGHGLPALRLHLRNDWGMSMLVILRPRHPLRDPVSGTDRQRPTSQALKRACTVSVLRAWALKG